MKLIATGNTLMKDDGIAIAVTEQLKDKLESLGLDVIIIETDCYTCFHSLKSNDFIIILDAMCTGKKPGCIHIYSLDSVLSGRTNNCMQNEMDLLKLMKLYQIYYKGFFIGIEVAELGFGMELSDFHQKNFAQTCEKVEKIIQNIIKGKYNRQGTNKRGNVDGT